MRKLFGGGILGLAMLVPSVASASTITLGFASNLGAMITFNAADSFSFTDKNANRGSHDGAEGFVGARGNGSEQTDLGAFTGVFSSARLAETGAGHYASNSGGSFTGYDSESFRFEPEVIALGVFPDSSRDSSGGNLIHMSNVGFGGSDQSFIDLARRNDDGLALSLTFANNRSHRDESGDREDSEGGHFNQPIDSGSAPEPASMLLLGTGLIGLGSAARRHSRQKNG